MLDALLVLEIFHVLFLAFHDWVPLGNLNNIKAVRAANPGEKLLVATLVSTAPIAFGLAASFFYADNGFPGWLNRLRENSLLGGKAVPQGLRPDVFSIPYDKTKVVP